MGRGREARTLKKKKKEEKKSGRGDVRKRGGDVVFRLAELYVGGGNSFAEPSSIRLVR
jgi:hypothetical protein